MPISSYLQLQLQPTAVAPQYQHSTLTPYLRCYNGFNVWVAEKLQLKKQQQDCFI
jgi:hypothetical protein